jgi:hypothetical protein
MTLHASGRPQSAKWLGQHGNVSGMAYSFNAMGGAKAASMTLSKPASYRSDAIDPGRKLFLTVGAGRVWSGVLDEPQPSDSGWQLTAHGTGASAGDFMAVFDNWAHCPDEAVDMAIQRGLPWINPGIGTPPGMWLGQRPDPGSISVGDLLSLVCARGGLLWYVSSRPHGNILRVTKLPTAVNRILVSSSPVPRTLGGDINSLWIRYKPPSLGIKFFNGSDATAAPEKNANVPQVRRTSVTNFDSVFRHGRMEALLDLTSAPRQTEAQAQAVGQFVLDRYVRASFAGPFEVGFGQLLTTGGHPIDLATEQAGTVCKLILTDYGYGGEVRPGAPQIITGEYEYHVEEQRALVTPFQSLRHDIAALMAEVAETRGRGKGL